LGIPTREARTFYSRNWSATQVLNNALNKVWQSEFSTTKQAKMRLLTTGNPWSLDQTEFFFPKLLDAPHKLDANHGIVRESLTTAACVLEVKNRTFAIQEPSVRCFIGAIDEFHFVANFEWRAFKVSVNTISRSHGRQKLVHAC
jgi:hypothetical protein